MVAVASEVGTVVIRAAVVATKVVGAAVADGLLSKNSVAAVAVSAVGSQVASRAVAATEHPT